MQSQFDLLAQSHPEDADLESWFARDLQEPQGYVRWENFLTAIARGLRKSLPPFTPKDADFLNESLWPEHFEWLRQRLKTMHKVFAPKVKDLKIVEPE